MKKNYLTQNHLDVVISKSQSKGRGRSDHVWESPNGNLYFSYILKKDIFIDNLFVEISKISVAIIKTLMKYGITASIKYPNDILVGTKKIAGILMETQGAIDLDYIVVGIGININQSNFNSLHKFATSTYLENGIELDPNNVALNIMNEYVKPHTFNEYLKHSIILNKRIKFNNQIFVVREILEDGRLFLVGNEKLYVSPNEISLKEIYE